MIETGLLIFICFWLLWIKLPVVLRLKLLGHPFLLDLSVSLGVFLLYGGHSTAAIMAATTAAVTMSICISMARKFFGFYFRKGGKWFYKIGKINLTDKILEEKRRLST